MAELPEGAETPPVTGVAGRKGFEAVLVEKSMMNGEVGFAAHASAFREGVLAEAIGRMTEYYSKYQVEGAYELLDGSMRSSIVNL